VNVKTEPLAKDDGALRGALHDVANTLTVLLGWAVEARDPEASKETIAYALAVIADEAKRGQELARRAIGVALLPQRSSATEVAERCVAALRLEAAKRRVVLKLKGAAGGHIDEIILSQIFTNLILNAIAFSPDGGVVSIKLSSDPHAYESSLDVIDEGKGVPLSAVATLFSGVSTRPGGSGVGLVHARTLARTLGGDLTLVEGPGGAHFRASWSVRGEAASYASLVPPPALSSRAVVSLTDARVLLLEDDLAVTAFLTVALEARGMHVVVVNSIDQLLALRSLHDVAVIDLSPLGTRAPEASQALRERCPSGRFIVTTGNPGALPAELLTARVVRKPFELAELVNLLNEILGSDAP
jgi:two-component system, NarL family, sensor histidine kinase EvgS